MFHTPALHTFFMWKYICNMFGDFFLHTLSYWGFHTGLLWSLNRWPVRMEFPCSHRVCAQMISLITVFFPSQLKNTAVIRGLLLFFFWTLYHRDECQCLFVCVFMWSRDGLLTCSEAWHQQENVFSSPRKGQSGRWWLHWCNTTNQFWEK